MISNKDLEDFKNLFSKHFGKELTNAEAMEKAIALITMVKHVYKPMTKEERARLEQRKKETDPK